MDQESFRRLLQTPRPGTDKSLGLSTTSRGSILASSTSKTKVTDPSQPSFKPRKVKKSSDAKYRDRAAERRVGEGNDYAQVEAVLEDFERRTASNEDKSAIEEQRRYLGGDSDHSILVKGLDVALLEQNKARAALSTEDDDSLEQAFLEASTEATVPKKRTREDLVRELKEKRGQKGDGAVESSNPKMAEEEARLLEDAKKKGKFKPIGAPVEEKGKKKKIKGEGKDGQRRKKKQNVGAVGGVDGGSDAVNTERRGHGDMLPPMAPVHATTVTPMVASTSMTVQSEPKPIEDDFDIFTGAGEYEGIDLGDDDEDEHRDMGKQQDTHPEEPLAPTLSTNKRGQWFATDDTNPPPSESPQTLALIRKSRSPAPQPPAEEGEIEPPTRLVPLQTSALPSIKDFLAMDEAVGALEKRRKRKEKRKSGKGGDDEESKKVSAEVKADRDYKRLKSYTEKKAGTSGTK